MPSIKFPDGSKKRFSNPIKGDELAKKISSSLFKSAVAIKIDGYLKDLNYEINKNGIKIIGETNILNKIPVSASNLYARNLFSFVINLYDKENKKINIEDEIVSKTLIK